MAAGRTIWKRAGRWLAVAAAVTVGLTAMALFAWNRVADRMVQKHDAAVPRDPVTGIMHAAEPGDFGPEDARCAVLFIHGFGGNGQHFEELPRKVAAAGWRARVLLLPGHGTLPEDFERTSADQLLNAVLDETQALLKKHEKVVLLGHSMGGALATLAAARTPEVSGLILGAPYFAITPRWYYILPPESWMRMGPSLMRWVYSNPDRQPVFRREVSSQIVSYAWLPTRAAVTAMELAGEASSPTTLSKINQPVLLLHGRRDEVTSPEAACRAVNGMASANKRIVLLDNSNHILFWDYERGRINDWVLQFLNDLSHTA